MIAMLVSLGFAAAAAVTIGAAVTTVHDSRARIVDALNGRPLPRVKPRLFVGA